MKTKKTTAILIAIAAAAFFGGSTPFAKQLLGHISPILLAGLLYLGSGIGLNLTRLITQRTFTIPRLKLLEWYWFLLSILFGGVLGPVFLMFGLSHTSAASASLLLNLESVLTALLAWVILKEPTDRWIILGMILIVAGGILLSWPQNTLNPSGFLGPLLITIACLCWAIDNNLTSKVSASDALFIAGSKGLVAGIVNTSLALIIGSQMPSWFNIGYAMLIGFIGYGISLVFFVLALRGLGSARTGAYFSTAPFIGAVIAILFFHDPATLFFWLAAVLMAIGVWLHIMEKHEHEHTHEALAHEHWHHHDEHHQHQHDFPWDNSKPHSHYHQHEKLTHSHPHFPDIHHKHKH